MMSLEQIINNDWRLLQMITQNSTYGHSTKTFANQGEFEAEMQLYYDYDYIEAKRRAVEAKPAERSFNVRTQQYTLLTYMPDYVTWDTYYDHEDCHSILAALKAKGFLHRKIVHDEGTLVREDEVNW